MDSLTFLKTSFAVIGGAGLLLAVGGLLKLWHMSRKIAARRRAEGKPPQSVDGKLGVTIVAIGLFGTMFLGILLFALGVREEMCKTAVDIATALWVLGALGFIAVVDSKKRWPGLGLSARLAKLFSFSRD